MTKEIFLKRSLTVNNAIITLGGTDDSGKGRHFKSRFIQPGLAGYPGQYGNALIQKKNLDKFVHTLRNKPVVINHKDEIKDKDKVGEVFNVWYNPEDGWYWCDGIITDKTAQNLIEDKKWSVSCSYDFTKYDDKGGTENNIPYDIEFLDGEFSHLAIVDNPRYEGANIVFNSKTDVNNDKWITIKPNGEEHTGRHLLVKDGETVHEAMERTYGIDGAQGQQKLFDTSGDRKTKEDFRREAAEKQAKIDEHQKQVQKRYDNLQYLGTAEPEKWEELGEPEMTFEKWESQREAQKQKEDKQEDSYYEPDMEETYTKAYEDSISKDFDEFMKSRKEDKKEEPKSLDQYLTDKSDKGWLYETKGTSTYSNSGKTAEVEEFGKDGGKYRVVFYDGNKRKDIKAYSTKRGMEKAVREHLSGEANKETKALETKTDLNTAQEKYNDILKKYSDAEHKKWESGLSNLEYHKAWEDSAKYKKELTTARREYAESIMANFEESDNTYYEDKQNARRERYEELSEKASKESEQAHQAFRDKMSFIPAGQPIHSPKDARYREKAWDTLGKAVKLSDKANYYEGKANSVGKAGISADDKNAIAKLTQKYKSGVDSAEKRRIIDRVIDIHTRSQKAAETDANTDYSEYGFEVERNTDLNRLQLKFPGKPDENVRSVLKSNGFRWSPREGAWQRQLTGNAEYSLKRVMEKLKANNSKEQDMALIEELKKLITRVENDKGDNMINNEKEDKRKLIDEVGGILEGKVDDEIIRTIIKKMEEASYNESEAGSADNKKVKNEADEDDKDDKEEVKNKKVKNEDEEDKEEVKEVKEDVKEDVDNKCKNSKDDFFERMNKIYNSAVKPDKSETEYVSRADRLKAGEDYFRV